MIRVDEEEINSIEICDFINDLLEKTIKTCTYNFNKEDNLIEFYETVKKCLFPKEMCNI